MAKIENDVKNYPKLKELSEKIQNESDPVKKEKLRKQWNKYSDPRMKMQPCGLSKGNANIINLIMKTIPLHGKFTFEEVYNSIPAIEFKNAHGHMGSWASPLTPVFERVSGVEKCKQFFVQYKFIEKVDDYYFQISDKGIDYKDIGTYEKYHKRERDIKRYSFKQLERSVKIWKDPRYWSGVISGAITMGIALTGIYLAWLHK